MSAQKTIEEAWEGRASLSPASAPRAVRDAVEEVIAGLDAGTLRCAEIGRASCRERVLTDV